MHWDWVLLASHRGKGKVKFFSKNFRSTIFIGKVIDIFFLIYNFKKIDDSIKEIHKNILLLRIVT